MSFEPIRLVSPEGRSVLVGSAIEREALKHRGYKLVAEQDSAPKPVETPEPAPAEPDEPKPATKRTKTDRGAAPKPAIAATDITK